MTSNENFSLHEISLFYLFTLGGSLFVFGKCGILCLLGAAFLGLITLLLALKVTVSKNRLVLTFLFFLSVITGLYTFGKFVYFIKEKQLFYTSIIFIGIVFAAVCLYLTVSDKKTLLKYSLLAFVICILFFFMLFFTTVKNIVLPDVSFGLDFKLKEMLKIYFTLYFPVGIPAFLIKPKPKHSVLGVTFTSITLIVFVTLTYCTFGAINGRLNSPILALVDTANVGRVYTRLDTFLLCIIYLSCLLRCAVCFKSAYGIVAIFNLKKQTAQLTKI